MTMAQALLSGGGGSQSGLPHMDQGLGGLLDD